MFIVKKTIYFLEKKKKIRVLKLKILSKDNKQ